MSTVRTLVPRRARARLRGWQLKVTGPGHDPHPPVGPVGVKLELTWRCNLRCGFCYTDSPRHTLARTADLPDEAWHELVQEALDLGVVEAVVTGGEPLLRRDLALDLVDRLASAGVAVVLNTNGWFVDEAVADRLARAPGLRVFVSIDGAAPALHDSARGVPGSWRRAIRGAHLLLERGVHVQVPHVVTPDNVAHLPEFLARIAALGVDGAVVSPVQPIGAAARSGGWTVERRTLESAVRAFRKAHGGFPAIIVRGEPVDALSRPGVPRSLLLRPNGDAGMNSTFPFAFGNAHRDGLSACWEQIRTRWNQPDAPDPGRPLDSPAPTPAPQKPVTQAELVEARDEVARLAESRRYRLGDVRWTGDVDGARLVRVQATATTVKLNRSAGAVMDACDGGTLADAIARLVARYPREDPGRLARDAAASVHRLLGDRIIRPALAP